MANLPDTNDGRIKILIVNSSLQIGGAEMQLARLAPQLDSKLFRVQVAYFNSASDSPRNMLRDAGVQVIFLGHNRWSRKQCLYDAYSLIKREGIDLVHAWSASANFYARFPAIVAGVPVIIGGLRGKSGMEGLWPYVYSLLNCMSSGWIVNSEAMKQFASGKMLVTKNCPIRIIRNGFDCSDEQIFRRDEVTAYDSLKRGVPVIGMVGRLHPVKNHALFIAMAKNLIEAGIDADFWIIGDGPQKALIEDMVSRAGMHDKIRLLGQRDDVDVALSRIDLLVLTSHSESCPNVLLEAMRASLPVVSTNCTSLENIITDGINGYVVAPDDVTGLVEKVRLILSDAGKRHEMGRRSREIVRERFDISAAARDLEQAYLYFLKRARNRKPGIAAKLECLGTC